MKYRHETSITFGMLESSVLYKIKTDDYNGICYVITTKAKETNLYLWVRSSLSLFHKGILQLLSFTTQRKGIKNIGPSCVILKLPIRRRGVRKSQGRLVRFSRPSHPPLLVVSLSPRWWWTWSWKFTEQVNFNESLLRTQDKMPRYLHPNCGADDQIRSSPDCLSARMHWSFSPLRDWLESGALH